MFQALFIALNTNLFLLPASLAPLFVLGATFSLRQVEWKLRGRLDRTESMWGRGTVTVLHSRPSPGVARALSLSLGSKAGIMSQSVSVFLCFLSDSAPIPHSWELTALTVTTGSRAEGPL